MENLTRLLSWAFVFGALAALALTQFKPSLKEMSASVSVSDVQGTVGKPDERNETPPARTVKNDCKKKSPAGGRVETCPERAP